MGETETAWDGMSARERADWLYETLQRTRGEVIALGARVSELESETGVLEARISELESEPL